MMLFITAVCLPLASCSESDEPETDISTKISGNYVGTMEKIGYSEPERAYVTLTRIAKDAVSIKMSCEGLDLDLNQVNLLINEKSNGIIQLTSESGYAISGNISGDALSVSFSAGYYDYSFFGQKE